MLEEMAEAIAAIGLVASIIQITDTAQKFLRRMKEYQEKTSRLPTTFQAIQIQLPLIISGLKAVEVRAERKELSDKSYPLIKPILESCQKEIENLNKMFAHLSQYSSTSSLNRAARAMKALRFDHDVQQSVAILKSHIDLLMWHQVNTSSMGASRLLLQDISQDAQFSSASVEDFCENETQVIISPLQGRNNDASVWEKHMRLDQCTCARGPFVRESTQWTLWSSSLSSQLLSIHQPGCSYFLEIRNLWKLSFSLKYTSSIFRSRLQVALSMQFGHGRIEIDPKLELRGVRRDNSPAFILFDQFEQLEDSQSPMEVGELDRQLRRLFERGEASPFELGHYDETLLHAACRNLFFFKSISNENCQERLPILETLRQLGVPLNEKCKLRCSEVFKYIITCGSNHENVYFLTLIKYLIDIGAESLVGDFFILTVDQMGTLIEYMRISPDIAEAFDCNVLQFALLRKSFSRVKKIIEERPDLVPQKNSLGHNSLHLAFDWPEAMELLLSTGATSSHYTDCGGHSPVAYAIKHKNIETLRLLLASGCPLLSSSDGRYGRRALEVCEKYFCRETFELIASTLVQRRLQLLKTARQTLSETTLREIISQNEDVPNVSAVRLINAILVATRNRKSPTQDSNDELNISHSKIREDCIDREYCSIYHTWNGPAEGAEILFNAGFSSILGKDEHGRSPIHLAQYFQDASMVNWYYKKGLDLAKTEIFFSSRGARNANPNLHWLILRGSYPIYKAIRGWLRRLQKRPGSTFGNDLTVLINAVLGEEFAHCVDECRCPCSPAGCNPVTILLKQLAADTADEWNKEISDWCRPYISALLLKSAQFLLGILERTPNWKRTGLVSRSFVRFTLYEILDVQHLCCTSHCKPYLPDDLRPGFEQRFSEEEFDVIVEETSTLREKFESLLPLAQSEWESTSKSWTRFWCDFYIDRVCTDDDDDSDKDSCSYLEAVTALGVKVEQEHEIGHHCSWVCFFEQPAEDHDDVNAKDERSAHVSLSEPLAAEQKSDIPIGDSIKLRRRTSLKSVCPFYEERKKYDEILPF